MKQIINNKRYDTESARHVGEWDNGLGPRDFSHCCENLYQKRTGEYFLYGRGGPMSKYAIHSGNTSSGGEEIVLLTAEEAREWAEEKLTAEDYEAEFSVIEDDERGIGQNIKAARESLNLTQTELAEKIGIAQTQLARYERDGQDPSATMVKRIAKALGINPGELLK